MLEELGGVVYWGTALTWETLLQGVSNRFGPSFHLFIAWLRHMQVIMIDGP
jgi:hypothetical protein